MFSQRPFSTAPFASEAVTAAGSVVVTPGTGALVLTGFVSTIKTPRVVLPGVGALVLTGLAPTVRIGIFARPGFGQLVLTGFAPAIVVGGSGSEMFTSLAMMP